MFPSNDRILGRSNVSVKRAAKFFSAQYGTQSYLIWKGAGCIFRSFFCLLLSWWLLATPSLLFCRERSKAQQMKIKIRERGCLKQD